MFSTERESLRRITEALRRLFAGRLVMVVAFGSRVRGDFSGESDFDLLVVIRDLTLEDELAVVKIISAEEEATGIPYSPVIKSLKSYEKEKIFKTGFYRNLTREGLKFYDAHQG
ncbi:MAG TPA: nucleotidyltransferase domain-containing protein [Nitrospirae bacterium]|nr:nucleotidyltransferase domain-containing protein [Nitrospirota bacterium]